MSPEINWARWTGRLESSLGAILRRLDAGEEVPSWILDTVRTDLAELEAQCAEARSAWPPRRKPTPT